MTRLTIDTGVLGNPATGDTLRTAMGKINSNFIELYDDVAASGLGGQLTNPTTNGDIKIQPNGTGIVEIDQLQITDDAITSMITNGDVTLTGNGVGGVKIESILINGTSISSEDSTTININDGLIIDGDLSVTGSSGITFSDNTITSSSSNANLELSAAGTGEVTTDANFKLISETPFLKIQRTDNANVPGIDFIGQAGTSGSKILFDGTGGSANELIFQTFTVAGGLAEAFRVTGTGARVTGTFNIISDSDSTLGDATISMTENRITTLRSNDNLEISANGTGTVKVIGNLTLDDSDEIKFGNAGDLRIFHNGSHSIVREDGTGSLYLQSDNNVILSKDTSTEIMVKGIADGAVELYHDNTKKFETTSGGVSVTGNLVADGSQIDFTNLPTSDPGVAGRLFRSGNDVKISTG